MEIRTIEDFEKHKEELYKLESAIINGVYIKNLFSIPLELLIYLRKELEVPHVYIYIKDNEEFYNYMEHLENFKKDEVYLIACSDGIKSSTLCDILRENDIECYWTIR
ncbi:MAG: hypothetical protein N2504_05905 [candidate division WOR-3 bacterium]|nr:hypothetical protein [candidate division WOR-3 bacterium]MCX7948105.1 hypothetical protein [candidate division WOR-3 bacterium]MDW8150817.1 hypothetical protein [candidate division WOR-3 bacterium]